LLAVGLKNDISEHKLCVKWEARRHGVCLGECPNARIADGRFMLFHCLLCVVSLLLDVLSTVGLASEQKDLEIALLRQQLRVLERRVQAQVRCTRPKKVMLVALVNRVNWKHRAIQDYLRSCLLLIKPKTVLKWHRELVRRKWTFQRAASGGRPRIDGELETLIVRLASENGRMGYGKIQGELLKLGYPVDETTIRNEGVFAIPLEKVNLKNYSASPCGSWGI